MKNPSNRSASHAQGSALLIVLAFLLLLTTLTVAFLSRATFERQLSNASFSQGKVDLTGQGAIATIIGDLEQEILAGSNGNGVASGAGSIVPGTTIPDLTHVGGVSTGAALTGYYYPNSPTTAIPAVVGFTSTGAGAVGLEDLLKISCQSPFYSGANYNATTYPAPTRGSTIATTMSSLNNRSVTAVRWNQPLLMTPTSTGNFAPASANFVVPTWIYVARDGSNPGNGTISAWDSSYIFSPSVPPTATPAAGTLGTNPITQRYAYAIYDEGGTLDLNVAGCPSYSNTSLTYGVGQPFKNALAYADLTQLTGISSLSTTALKASFVNAIVGWRNYASAKVTAGTFPGSYTFNGVSTTPTAFEPFDFNTIFNPGGFLSAEGYNANGPVSATASGLLAGPTDQGAKNQSDNSFASRQQLLQFVIQGLGQNTTFSSSLLNLEQALPCLGTFSRDISQPSYAPDPNRPVVQAVASGGNDMAGQAYSAAGQNIINPAFLSQTASIAFTRNDGTTAVIGDPLVKKRFALNRLAWLTYLGPITSTSSPRSATSLTAPSSTLFSNGNSNYDYDIYLLENTYGIPVSFLAQGTAANIYNYFGLSWVSDSRPTGVSGTGDSQLKWVYNHTNSNSTGPFTALPSHPASPSVTTRIWTLSQVAAAGREPDFFELLKAAMTAGSLGKCAHLSGAADTTNTTYQYNKDTSLDAQVIQIGANIIAQFQPSGVPPRILFDDGSWTAQAQEYRGVEDLPYLYSVTGGPTRLKDTNPTFTTAANGPNNGTPSAMTPATATLADADAGAGAYFMVPSIWNPHALNPNVSGTAATTAASTVITAPTNANVAAYAAAMGPRPTQFRIFAIGGTPNMTGPPTTLDPNQVSVLATCRYSGGTGAPNPDNNVTDPQTYTNGLQTPISLNPPDVSLPDTSLTFSIPLTYTGSVASPTAPTTAWRPDLFREPTKLNKPQVPSGSSLQFGANNIVRTGLFATLFSTQLTKGNGGLENSLGDQNICYTAVGATDGGSTTTPPAYGLPAYLGIFMGAFPLSWNYSTGGQNYIISAGFATTAQSWGNIYMTYRIQCKDPATGNWETYDEKLSHPTCYGWGTNEYDINATYHATQTSMVMSNAITGDADVVAFADPRTSRFGVFFNDPRDKAVENNGNWAWPMMVRARNTASNWYNGGFRTGWAAPTSASTAAINQVYSANAAAQNAMYTFRPDEEGGFSVGYTSGNTTPPAALGWYSVGSGPWQLGNICQNNPASTDKTSWNAFGFFSAADAFGQPGSNPGSVEFYADADGVVRRAMAGYLQPGTNPNLATDNVPAAKRPAGAPSGVPMAWTYSYATTAATIPGQAAPDTTYSNNVSSRPVMLNRPFRTVAELGHVFSDTPWRNLDFSTPESGSSALLDVFCINDTNDPGGLVAGKVDLNTRQAPVLQAVIAGAFQDTFNPTTASIAGTGSTTTATADNIAKALVARTTDAVAADITAGAGPLRNITELAGKYSGSNVLAAGTTGTSGATGTAVPPWDGGQTYVGFSGAPTTASGTAPYHDAGAQLRQSPFWLCKIRHHSTMYAYTAENIQRYRESAIRALSAAGTTRVWNLMIDVIAQTGRFPASASSLANFNVEGERRYWVHVAIDRYTGKVLDEQVEEVKE